MMNISNEQLLNVIGGWLMLTMLMYSCFRLFKDEIKEMP